jgi:hypothetical protein
MLARERIKYVGSSSQHTSPRLRRSGQSPSFVLIGLNTCDPLINLESIRSYIIHQMEEQYKSELTCRYCKLPYSKERFPVQFRCGLVCCELCVEMNKHCSKKTKICYLHEKLCF